MCSLSSVSKQSSWQAPIEPSSVHRSDPPIGALPGRMIYGAVIFCSTASKVLFFSASIGIIGYDSLSCMYDDNSGDVMH